MNTSSANRLLQKQEESLASCRANITQWQKHKKDYESLFERIKTLPDKTSHDMMVPLGPLALVPGKVVHTNEIIVLLGDNWFAERSCKQACEIIQRRIKQCDTMLSKFHEEQENIKNWMGFTDQMRENFDDCVEIVEEYDETKEKLWKEEHRKSEQKYRKQLAEERRKILSPQSSIHPQVINEEPENTSQENASGGHGDSELNMYKNRGRRVSWQDQSNVIPKRLSKEDEEMEESETDDEGCPIVINFSHTGVSIPDALYKPEDNDREEAVSNSSEIISPADIYNKFGHFLQKTPKSILKKREGDAKGNDAETQPSFQLPSTSKDSCVDIQSPTTSVKKSSSSSVVLQSVIERTPIEPASNVATSRPTSRFKVQRQSAQKKI